jgi:hypothetical protein
MTRRIEQSFDLVIAGGGLAGVCAALAAARRGLKTCLVQERPVLGGVASSEVCVTVHGAGWFHVWARETGLVAEIQAEDRIRNHEPIIIDGGWTNRVFDQVMYDFVTREPNLTLHLNTAVTGVLMEGGDPVEVPPHTDMGYYERPACAQSRRIAALVARTLSAETEMVLRAPLFVDATGDALIADHAGCGWRMGIESKAETGEPHAPEKASTSTMGNSIYIRAKNIGRDAPFTPPAWAELHHDPDFFYKQGRHPRDPRAGFWWIEIGIPWHTIYDNETIRHELTRHAYGVWDWMKNHDPVMKEKCRTWALDFIGQVPGKRESRRVYGRHWLNENELQARTHFPDEIAYGGWRVDLHTPGGLLAPNSEPLAAIHGNATRNFHDDEYEALGYVGPYGLPLRSLMARDVDNLFLAGRCLSVTHAALGTARVMATCGLMGQAVGTAASVMRERGMDLPALAEDAAVGGAAVRAVQQALLRDGCFLPNISNNDADDLARTAMATASSSALLYGLSPDEPAPFMHELQAERRAGLDKNVAQNVWCGAGRMDRLELCLDNPALTPVQVPVRLVKIDNVFDYRLGGSEVLARGAVTVLPGNGRWAGWDVSLDGLAAGWMRLEIGPAPGVYCLQARGVLPGHNSYGHLSSTRLRPHPAALAFKISPPQPAFGPEQVLSGVARPLAAPNQWCSDAGQGLPQWFQLEWAAPQGITRIELTFPGQLLTEGHIDGIFHASPQVAKDYAIEVDAGDGVWRELERVEGNWAWRRAHDLPTATTARCLRVVISATNGAPAASLSEIRCYR